MTKTGYIKEITSDISRLDSRRLRQISDFVKYLSYQNVLEDTLEILNDKDTVQKITIGLKEKANKEVVSWDSVR